MFRRDLLKLAALGLVAPTTSYSFLWNNRISYVQRIIEAPVDSWVHAPVGVQPDKVRPGESYLYIAAGATFVWQTAKILDGKEIWIPPGSPGYVSLNVPATLVATNTFLLAFKKSLFAA